MTDAKQNPLQILLNISIPEDLSMAPAYQCMESLNPTSGIEIKVSPQQIFEKGLAHFFLHQDRDALKLFTQAAHGGYLPGYLFLGVLYQEGISVKKDINRAKLCFKKIKKNLIWFQPESETNPFLLYCLGELSVYDKDPRLNLKPAAEYFQKAAELGYVAAFCKLGLCYQQGGYGVSQNDLAAILCFKTAAAGGNVEAIRRLGSAYFRGCGVDQDKVKAFSYFRRAAKQGNVWAQANLGGCYLDGEGVPKDAKQGIVLLRWAADQGFAHAQVTLAECYFKGEIVPKDTAVAYGYSLLAAQLGNAVAQLNLGIYNLEGIGRRKDAKRAVLYLRQAADQGLAEAVNLLGKCYRDGRGLPKDAKQAVSLYRKAMEQGNNQATHNLGFCYLYGMGVPQDEKLAVTYFQKAADQEVPAAQHHLGSCYLEGVGLSKDETQGMFWLMKSAVVGNARGIDKLKKAGVDLDQYIKRRKGIAAVLQKAAVISPDLEKLVMEFLEDPMETREAIKNAKDEKWDAVKTSLDSIMIGGVKQKDRNANLLRLKADRGEMQSAFELGEYYEFGIGEGLDIAQAVRWYKQAAKKGHVLAHQALKRISLNMSALVLAELSQRSSFARQKIRGGEGLIGDIVLEYLKKPRVHEKFVPQSKDLPKDEPLDALSISITRVASSSSSNFWTELQRQSSSDPAGQGVEASLSSFEGIVEQIPTINTRGLS